MPPRDETIDKILNLPEADQKDFLGKLSPEARQGIFTQMGNDYTLGERYRFQRAAGLLPQAQVSSFVSNPRQRLGEVAAEAGNLAQTEQYEGYNPKHSYVSQMGHGMLSELYEGVGVGAKLAGGFTDPKTIAAFIVSKLGPTGALASAQYFGYQSADALADAIKTGKVTPENLQNALIATAGIAGAGAMSGEAPKTPKITPADIKSRLQPFARQVTGAEAATREAVTKTASKFADESKANEIKRQKITEENELQRKRSRFRAGEEEYQRSTKNQATEQANAQAQQDFENAKTQRTEQMRQSETQAKAARTSIEQVENKVYQEANRKYEAVREKIGAGRPGEPEESSQPLLDSVKSVQRTILQGIPENVALFRSILKLEGDAGEMGQLRTQVMQGQGMGGRFEDLRPEQQALVDEIAQRYGGQLTEGDPVTWGKLQRIKTASETAMRSRSTPPIIREALSRVNDVVTDTMGKMAEQRGATADWNEARDFYRQWREDFHQSTGPQGSASPIAQTLQAVDPYAIQKTLGRTQGVDENRAVQILRKYPQYGGNEAASSVEQAVRTHQGIGKQPKAPTAQPTEPTPTVSKLFPQKEVPAKTETPTVDVADVSRKAIEQRAKNWGAFNARDVGIIASSVIAGPIVHILFGSTPENASALLPTAAITYEGGKYAGSRALRNPKVISWLEKAPPEEIAALRRIPGADRIKIVNGITDDAVAAMKTQDFSADSGVWDRAKKEAGPNASFSDIAARATKMNQEAIAERAKAYRSQKANGRGPVAMSPEIRAFLGPENVAKILAASGTGAKPVQNRKEAVEALPRP